MEPFPCEFRKLEKELCMASKQHRERLFAKCTAQAGLGRHSSEGSKMSLYPTNVQSPTIHLLTD